MRISVIIPTFNRSEFLLRAIKSVLSQTSPVFEILVCDDGSTDDSEEKVLALKNNKVRWIEGKHSGLPGAVRNRGIKISKGDWIAFLDSDDAWFSYKVEKQIGFIKKNRICDLVYTDVIHVGGNNDGKKHFDLTKPYDGFVYGNLIKDNFIVNSSVLVSKKALKNVEGFNDGRTYKGIEDYDLWLRLSKKYKFFGLKEPLVKYSTKADGRLSSNFYGIKNSLRLLFLKNFFSAPYKYKTYLFKKIFLPFSS